LVPKFEVGFNQLLKQYSRVSVAAFEIFHFCYFISFTSVPQLTNKEILLAKILVTGVGGFVGKHLARELSERGHQVVGVGISPEISDSSVKNLLSGYYACDLTSPDQVSRLPINDIEGVISLAGLAQVGPSFSEPEKYKKVNVEVLSVLAKRIINEKLKIKVVAVSTGAVYEPNQPLPITEESKLADTGSPYGQSKILMEEAAGEFRNDGLDCVIVRPFNHIGPGQEKGFLVGDLYAKIVQAKQDGQPLMVGNLNTKRDYTDVRDVVRAYADLAEQPQLNHSLYNVCSGHSVSGADILKMLLGECGVTSQIEVKVDQALIRPTDTMDIFGNYDRLKGDVNWSPQIGLDKTIKDFVEFETTRPNY
jgi:GDP-4-dehydro-6-deoxy-D-mannose reductase